MSVYSQVDVAIRIFNEYTHETGFAVDGGEIFCGSTPPDKIKADHLATLAENRWFWSELYECWTHLL